MDSHGVVVVVQWSCSCPLVPQFDQLPFPMRATARAIDPQRPVRPVLLPRLHCPKKNAALSARVNRRRVSMKPIFLITFLAAGILLASAQIKPPSAPPPVPLPPSAGCNNGRGCTAKGGAVFRPYSSLSRARTLY